MSAGVIPGPATLTGSQGAPRQSVNRTWARPASLSRGKHFRGMKGLLRSREEEGKPATGGHTDGP